MYDDHDVAIIGGGAAAAATIVALSERTQGKRPSILWVAPASCDGRGLAYGTREHAHRLNVRAHRMSVRADQSDDFVEFLKARDGRADPQGFYPRHCYGDYLTQRTADAWSNLTGERWPVWAHSLRHDGHRWIVQGNDGGRRRARHLVLAIGPQPQVAQPGVDPALLRNGGYRIDPYDWMGGIKRDGHAKEIWIIGSGLTAVDLVLTAATSLGEAHIHLISRHAALPCVHAAVHRTVADPFAAELHLPKASLAMRRLRAAAADDDWRAQMDCMRVRTADRWQRWPTAEKQRFLRHARWAWDCSRHRMAPEVAAAVRALKESGQLQLHQGRVVSVDANQQRAELRWRPRGADSTQVHIADLVLQATGLNTCVSGSSDPLLRGLLDHGLARADALDMGLAVDSRQRVIAANGQVRGDAHVIGAMARGSRFECIAMPEIRSTAAAIADDLLQATYVCRDVHAPVTARVQAI